MTQEKSESLADPPTDFLQFYLSRSTKGAPGVITGISIKVLISLAGWVGPVSFTHRKYDRIP